VQRAYDALGEIPVVLGRSEVLEPRILGGESAGAET
jgi:hypothetical protein